MSVPKQGSGERAPGAHPPSSTLPEVISGPLRAPKPLGAQSKAAIRAALFRPQQPVRVGRYQLRGTLGQGGMGTVLRAYDETLDREVAVKLLHRDLGKAHGDRLLREAQALARLSHPHVVQVYEVGEVEGQAFIAMELVHGSSLAQWQEHPHPWRECVAVYQQAGRGLAAAHGQGLVHRDFKPSNCILDEDHRVRVLDFGLARVAGAEPESSEEAPDPGESMAGRSRSGMSAHSLLRANLTHTGSVMGTLVYMAPEQRRGTADAKSDQFSFCVSLFEAIHGQRPYPDLAPGNDDEASERRRPLEGQVPGWLSRAIARGLSTRPEDRWPSMDALLAELSRAEVGRGRWWLGASLLGAAGLLGLGLWLRPVPAAPPCDDGPQQLAGVWDPPRREAVRHAILGTGVSYADATWSRVQTELDEHAARWVRAWGEVCEAPLPVPTDAALDPRQRCLRMRRVELRHDVELLAEADARMVEHAVPMVVGLTPIDPCLHASAPDAEPPRSAEQAQALEALEARLDQARALLRAGRPEPGLDALDPVLAELKAQGDPRRLARAHRLRGELHLAAGHPERAEADLRAAYLGAIEHDDPRGALEVLSSLIYVVGVERAQASGGRWLGATAQALAAQHDPTGPLRAACLTAEGQVHAEQGEYPLAQERFEHALALLERERGPGHLDLVMPLDGLAQVLRKRGTPAAAQSHYERALAIRREQLGAEHPAVAHLLTNLGAVLDDQGHHDRARARYEEALAILHRTVAADHPQVAHAEANLGAALARQGRPREAEPHLRRAIEIWARSHGPHHPRVAKARVSLGVVLKQAGSFDNALAQYQQALGSLSSEASETQPDRDETMANVLVNIGVIHRQQGRLEQAEASYREALDIFVRTVGPRGTPVAGVLDKLGGLSYRRDDFAAATQHHERALAIRETAQGSEHRDVANTLWALARARQAQGQAERARADLLRALDVLDRVQSSPQQRAKTELLLAELRWDAGERESATTLARTAAGRLAGIDHDPLAARIDAWLADHPAP